MREITLLNSEEPGMIPTLDFFGLIADGERGALIGPSGEIAWMCMPAWDGDAAFSSLLGGEGTYAITPVGRFVWGGYYEPGSLIWRSRWILESGSSLESREALAFPGKPEHAIILRRLMALEGSSRVRISLDFKPSYGRERLRDLKYEEGGVWTAHTEKLYMRWTGAAGASIREGGALSFEVELAQGGNRDLLLELSTRPFDSSAPDPDSLWRSTETNWEQSVPKLDECLEKRDARHAYAVLRGLRTSSGGIVAAATTSLPERADSGRNYDYRYIWIRDLCWAGQAISQTGSYELLCDAVRFVRERLLSEGPELRPAYTPSGNRLPHESELGHLPGYPGASKIVVGNKAGEQFQLDAFGEILLLLAASAEHGCFEAEDWQAVQVAVSAIEKRWKDKGSGLWELKDRIWTHSRLMSIAGLKQIAKYAASRGTGARWLALAEAIEADTSQNALHPSGRWKRSTDDERVDASLLLAALRGAIEPEDPRSLATLEAIEQELTQDGFCYRFKASVPLSKAEGAFTICNYWLALAHLQLGHAVEATRWFERARTAYGPPGLYTEEYDVVQREQRGNLPQAFVHALMLECAARMGKEPAYKRQETQNRRAGRARIEG